jgi:hypothetical protein
VGVWQLLQIVWDSVFSNLTRVSCAFAGLCTCTLYIFKSQVLLKAKRQCSKAKLTMCQVKAFWVVMLCSVVVGYQRFRGPRYLHLQPVHWLLGHFLCTSYWLATPAVPLQSRPISMPFFLILATSLCRWRQHGPLNRWYHTTTLYGASKFTLTMWSWYM